MRVVLDRHAIYELDRQRPLHEEMLKHARFARRKAWLLAPNRSGHYRASLFARPMPSSRALAVYGATDFKAWWVEYGTVRGIPRKTHVLSRAGRLAGMKVDEAKLTRWAR